MGIVTDDFGDVDFGIVGLTHIEQLISNICCPCEDVVSSLLDKDV